MTKRGRWLEVRVWQGDRLLGLTTFFEEVDGGGRPPRRRDGCHVDYVALVIGDEVEIFGKRFRLVDPNRREGFEEVKGED